MPTSTFTSATRSTGGVTHCTWVAFTKASTGTRDPSPSPNLHQKLALVALRKFSPTTHRMVPPDTGPWSGEVRSTRTVGKYSYSTPLVLQSVPLLRDTSTSTTVSLPAPGPRPSSAVSSAGALHARCSSEMYAARTTAPGPNLHSIAPV